MLVFFRKNARLLFSAYCLPENPHANLLILKARNAGHPVFPQKSAKG
uniref:Uncharacterized protein n=1 Tax=Leclercia adecarboxylata TaxID=83655 RepID=A0A482LYP8_9ENTR|nr:Hypothetical protein [Leclercia adecarboxylata]